MECRPWTARSCEIETVFPKCKNLGTSCIFIVLKFDWFIFFFNTRTFQKDQSKNGNICYIIYFCIYAKIQTRFSNVEWKKKNIHENKIHTCTYFLDHFQNRHTNCNINMVACENRAYVHEFHICITRPVAIETRNTSTLRIFKI